MTGLTSYHAGRAAEDCVERHYGALGYALVARRWRGAGGEIDLILRRGGDLVAVEVKKSRTAAGAAIRLGTRQAARLRSAAEEFCAGEPAGLLTPLRFDLATVDAMGRVDVVENALA